MVLTLTKIDSVTPSGGGPGTAVVVLGSDFGVATGTIVFDPTGVALQVTPDNWQNDQVDFTVPAGLPDDRHHTLQLIKADGSDFATETFWLPAATPATNDLDFQRPGFEAGTPFESVDNLSLSQAADLNRLLDRLNATVAGIGDMLKSVYDTNTDNIVDVAQALNDAGTPRTFLDIVALIGAGGGLVARFDQFTPSSGQTTFNLSATPNAGFSTVLWYVNGVMYSSPAHTTEGPGTLITWLDTDFTMATTDRVEAFYFV